MSSLADSVTLQGEYTADWNMLTIAWSIIGAVCLPNIVALVYRRNHVLVQKRNFWSMIIQISCIILFSCATVSDVLFNGYCWVSTGVAAMFLDFNFVLIIERTIGLLVEFSFSKEAQNRFQHFKSNIDAPDDDDEDSANGGTSRDAKPSVFEDNRPVPTHGRTRSRAMAELESFRAYKWRTFFHSHSGYAFSQSKWWALAVGFLASSPPFIIFLINRDVAWQNVHLDARCGEVSQYVSIYQLSMATLALVITVVCFRGLRTIQDNFYIKQELNGLMFTMFIKWLYLVVCVAERNIHQFKNNIFAFFLLIVIPVIDTLASVTSVVYLSSSVNGKRDVLNKTMKISMEIKQKFGDDDEKVKQVSKSKEVLQFLFEDDIAAKAFEQFLLKDLSVENILFYRAVLAFEKSFKPVNDGQLKSTVTMEDVLEEQNSGPLNPDEAQKNGNVEKKDSADDVRPTKSMDAMQPRNQKNLKTPKRIRVALNIYDEYVSSSALLCVNISGACRNRVSKVIAEIRANLSKGIEVAVDQNIFFEAKEEVFELTWFDSYPRFRTTPEFAELQRDRKKELVELHTIMTATQRLSALDLKLAPSPERSKSVDKSGSKPESVEIQVTPTAVAAAEPL
jgi:hypothetical protein